MNDSIRVKVASKGVAVLMLPFALGCLAAIWRGIVAMSHGDYAFGGILFAVAAGIFGLNYVLKQKLGHDVEIAPDRITEHRRSGPVTILWSEPHELEGYDSAQQANDVLVAGTRGVGAYTMMKAGKIQNTVVKAPDGRRIRVDTVFGSPAHEMIARFSAAGRTRAAA